MQDLLQEVQEDPTAMNYMARLLAMGSIVLALVTASIAQPIVMSPIVAIVAIASVVKPLAMDSITRFIAMDSIEASMSMYCIVVLFVVGYVERPFAMHGIAKAIATAFFCGIAWRRPMQLYYCVVSLAFRHIIIVLPFGCEDVSPDNGLCCGGCCNSIPLPRPLQCIVLRDRLRSIPV